MACFVAGRGGERAPWQAARFVAAEEAEGAPWQAARFMCLAEDQRRGTKMAEGAVVEGAPRWVAGGRRRRGPKTTPWAEAEAMALLRRSSAGIRLCQSLCSWLGSGVLNFLCGTTEAAKPNALPSSAWCSSVKLYKKLVSANNMYIICG